MRQVTHFIDGKITPASATTQPVFNSYSGETVAEVSIASVDETQRAIAIAKARLADWRNTPPLKRARIFFRYKALLEENAPRFAEMLATEHGKVYNDAMGEIQRGIEVVEFICGIPHLLKGEFSMNVGTGIDSYVLNQPVGVCVGITPFNFPFMVPLWMFPVAIACGNTFVLKPSEKDPSSSLILAELLQEAGLPDGVLNVVNGSKDAVNTLLMSPDTDAISFVGSTQIAKYIYETASAQGKRVQALGGAKNHMIVMPDASIDDTVRALLGAAYGSAGERCMAISVAVAVGDKTADALIAQLKPAVENLKIGPGVGAGKDNDMGPLISAEHLQKVREYVGLGVDEGAELVVDGRDFQVSDYPGGYFIGGSLFDKVTSSMRIYQEEIFGPVLVVLRVASLEEGLQLIADHEYGNGAVIFTKDGEAAHRFCDQVQSGMVGINVPLPVPVSYHAFGGWKRSIFGALNIYGPEGIRFYTKPKTVTARWKPDRSAISQFHFPVNR